MDQELRYHRAVTRGRPKVVVDKDRLLFLRDCGFKVGDIATFFGCNRRTIERHLHEYGIPNRRSQYASVTDQELDKMVLSIVSFSLAVDRSLLIVD